MLCTIVALTSCTKDTDIFTLDDSSIMKTRGSTNNLHIPDNAFQLYLVENFDLDSNGEISM